MKKLNLKNWEGVNDAEMLKYFVQLIEDMLFDYNLSSHKVKMLNTHYLCEEFLYFYPLIKDKIIHEKAHNSIIEELQLSLNRDYIAKEILQDLYEGYLGEIKNNLDNIDNLYKTIEVLNNILRYKYYPKMISEIISIVKNNLDEKNKLRSITQSFLSELINKGYSKRHIYNLNNNYFFNDKKEINSLDIIEDFLKIFNLEERKYNILFKIKKDINLFNALEKIPFKVYEKLPEEYSPHSDFAEDNYMFIEAKEIPALDIYSANEKARYYLSAFEAFILYNDHKFKVTIDSKSLALDTVTLKSFFIYEEAKGIFKQPNTKVEYISRSIEKTYEAMNRLKGSPEEIFMALKSHSDALKTDNLQHQFITLWSALESLVISTNTEKTIGNIISTLEPAIVMNYFSKLTKHLHNYLIRNYSVEYRKILSKIKGDFSEYEKSLLLFSLKEKNEPLRDELYELVKINNPLLVNKMYYQVKIISSTSALHKSLSRHLNYVRWQIQRIYRARNAIVHGNRSVNYLNSLIENLHEYFDKTIDSIFKISEINPFLTNIDGIFLHLKIMLDNHVKLLKKDSDINIDESNFKKYLLNELEFDDD